MRRLIEITKKTSRRYLGQILEIENLSFGSPWSLNAFKTELKNPVAHLWALILDEALSGYLCFWMFANEIQLINVAVHPQQRGRGIGEFLVTKMIENSVSKGMQNIWLEVRPSNSVARGLYEKLGFMEINRRPRYYPDTNEDAIVMSLSLTERKALHTV